MIAGHVFRDAAANAAFARDGVFVAPLLDAAEVRHVRAVYDRYPEQHATPFSATILSGDLEYRQHAHRELHAVFASRVEAMFSDYRVFMAGFLAKQPDPDSSMPLHQDLTLVAPGERPALSIWCPLVDVTPENGAVQVARGSHVLNAQPRAAGTPFAYPELEPELRAQYLRPVPMGAGEALFLHHSVFHASPPNLSRAERPVAAIVLAPMESPLVYFHRDPGPPAMLEEYAVDDEFYLRHQFGVRPEQTRLVAIRPESVDPFSHERFVAAVGPPH